MSSHSSSSQGGVCLARIGVIVDSPISTDWSASPVTMLREAPPPVKNTSSSEKLNQLLSIPDSTSWNFSRILSRNRIISGHSSN